MRCLSILIIVSLLLGCQDRGAHERLEKQRAHVKEINQLLTMPMVKDECCQLQVLNDVVNPFAERPSIVREMSKVDVFSLPWVRVGYVRAPEGHQSVFVREGERLWAFWVGKKVLEEGWQVVDISVNYILLKNLMSGRIVRKQLDA